MGRASTASAPTPQTEHRWFRHTSFAALIAACPASPTAGCISVTATPTAGPAAHQRVAARPTSARPTSPIPQTAFPSPHSLSITVKEVGPLAAESADLHDVVTLFGKASHQAFTESVIEPGTRRSGFITAVRDRGRFRADALLTPAGVSALRAGRRIISVLTLLGKAVLGRRLLLRHELIWPPTSIATQRRRLLRMALTARHGDPGNTWHRMTATRSRPPSAPTRCPRP